MVILAALGAGLLVWFFIGMYQRSAARKNRKKQDSDDYGHYRLNWKETLFALLISLPFFFAIGYLFYKSLIIALCFSALGCYYPKMLAAKKLKRRRETFIYQFKTALYSLSAALGSGKSVENGFLEIVGDLQLLYGDPQNDMIREIEIINQKVKNGIPVEQAVLELSRRIDEEDVVNFSEAFQSCKRTGGDLVEVIGRTSHMIGEKIEISQEINVLIAQKKFEAHILSILPFMIIAFITFSSPDYALPLYQGLGRVIMSAALLAFAASYWMTQKIMSMKV